MTNWPGVRYDCALPLCPVFGRDIHANPGPVQSFLGFGCVPLYIS